jgi:hypothetical protein
VKVKNIFTSVCGIRKEKKAHKNGIKAPFQKPNIKKRQATVNNAMHRSSIKPGPPKQASMLFYSSRKICS